jgi:hypothetical protein
VDCGKVGGADRVFSNMKAIGNLKIIKQVNPSRRTPTSSTVHLL